MKLRILSSCSVIVLLSALVTRADADEPWEMYHVSKSSIAAVVLKNAIGVLTLNTGYQREGELFKTYKKNGSRWAPDQALDVANAIPVSNFGYHAAQNAPNDYVLSPSLPKWKGIANYRFPVLKREGAFLDVVINPIDGSHIWVSSADLAGEFIVHLDYFDELIKLKQTYVDVFFGEAHAKRRVYAQPSLSAKSSELSVGRLYKVTAEQNGFIQIAEENGEDGRKIIGWVPIHDSAGLLTIWIVLADSC